MLAGGGNPPRQRARDQQADRIGEALRRRVLDRLAALDPEPDGIEAALARVVAELGEPSGPTRSLCALIRQEWESVRSNPAYWQWLLAEAVAADESGASRSRGRRRGSEPAP